MAQKKYNWPLMIRDIMDTAFLSQAEMAGRLRVSQQSVSNWLKKVRNPSAETVPALLKLAQDTGLDIGSYEANPDFDRINEYMRKNKGRALVRIFELYGRMGMAEKRKFMRYAAGKKS